MRAHPGTVVPIAKKVDNLKDYDVVFLGFPIWWYIAPNVINNFLSTQDFKGKTIIPFFTSYSSGPGNTDRELHKSITYEVTWKPATRLNSMNDQALKAWMEKSMK